jgi:putative MATE family efflux protein
LGFPRLEVLGAAYGANLAAVVGAVLVLIVLLGGVSQIRVRLRDIFTIHGPVLAMLIRIGLPAGLDMFLMRISFVLYCRIIASLGTAALAANAVALRVESLSFMPGMGIAMAAGALVGQSLGAGSVALAEKTLKRCTWIAVAVMGALGLMLLVAARPVSALFVSDPEMIRLSALCIQISALEQPLLGFVMVYMGGLRGAGDTLSAMFVTLICSTLVRLPVVYFLAITLHFGLVGAWVGAVIDWAVRSGVVYLIARWGRWKRIKVEISVPPTVAEEVVTETVALPPVS